MEVLGETLRMRVPSPHMLPTEAVDIDTEIDSTVKRISPTGMQRNLSAGEK